MIYVEVVCQIHLLVLSKSIMKKNLFYCWNKFWATNTQIHIWTKKEVNLRTKLIPENLTALVDINSIEPWEEWKQIPWNWLGKKCSCYWKGYREPNQPGCVIWTLQQDLPKECIFDPIRSYRKIRTSLLLFLKCVLVYLDSDRTSFPS